MPLSKKADWSRVPAKIVQQCNFNVIFLAIGTIVLVAIIERISCAHDRYNRATKQFKSSAIHVHNEGSQNQMISLEIIHTATSAGRFVARTGRKNGENNWTDITGMEYRVPLGWAQGIGFSPTLSEGFHRIVHTVDHENVLSMLPELDQKLISGLRGKTLLLMGSSTTENIYSTICHCPRSNNADVSIQGVMKHDAQTECFDDIVKGCEGPRIRTCRLNTLNLTLHSVEGEYTVHPYGPMPYGRGERPKCEPTLDLASCLKKKWDVSCNTADGMECMRNSSCANHRPPDFVFYDINLWFWFRMQWYGSFDEKDFQSMPWGDIEKAYMANVTTVLETLVGDYLNDVKVVALQTTPGPKVGGRVSIPRVFHINSAIRELAVTLMDLDSIPPVGLLELDHMGHMGWDRSQFLKDDLHPQIVFNHAVSNILLNALAVL